MKGSLVSSAIAEPYSQALMSLAEANNLSEAFGEDLRSLLNLLENSPELRDFLGNPVIQDAPKKAVLARIMEGDSHPYLTNFMMLLVDKRRIAFLKEVCEEYLTLLRKLTNTVLAEVSAARELNDEQRQAVTQKIQELTGATTVELKTKVDPDLIGGVVIKVGSQVFDASLRGQLRRISLNLLGGS